MAVVPVRQRPTMKIGSSRGNGTACAGSEEDICALRLPQVAVHESDIRRERARSRQQGSLVSHRSNGSDVARSGGWLTDLFSKHAMPVGFCRCHARLEDRFQRRSNVRPRRSKVYPFFWIGCEIK